MIQRRNQVEPKWQPSINGIRTIGLQLALATSLSLATTAAAASTPWDALDYVGPEVDEALEELEDAEAQQSIVRLMDASVSVSPRIIFADWLDDEDPATTTPSIGLDAQVGYTYDRVAVFRKAIAVVNARASVDRARRVGVEQALATHHSLLVHQLRVEHFQERVTSAQRDLDDGRARVDAGEATLRELEQLQLRLQEEQLNLEATERGLLETQEEAERFGLDTPAEYESIRFSLPETSAEQTLEAERLRLLVELAQARLVDETLYDTLRDLNVRGEYSTGDVNFGTEAGIIKGLPRAEVDVGFPGGRERWRVALSATIVADTDLLRVPEFEDQVEDAMRELEEYLVGFPRALEEAAVDVAIAEQQLVIDERQLELELEDLEEASAEFSSLRNAVDSATEEQRGELEAELRQARVRLERAQTDARSARSSVYGAWNSYLRAVRSYLSLTEGHWRAEREAP